jgi:WD40 repeat protein
MAIDRNLVTSGFDTETLVSEKYLSYLMLAQVEAGLMPLQFDILEKDPVTRAVTTDMSVTLHPPTEELYETRYVQSQDPPMPDRALHTFECELVPGEATGFAEVAFTPDGLGLLTCSVDSRIRLWDIASRKQDEDRSFEVNAAIGVAFNPACTHVATAAADGKVRVWNIAARAVETTLTGHTRVVECVAFSPDGQRLVSGSFDATARIWDLATGQSLHTLSGHVGRVTSVAFDRTGTRVVTGGEDHLIRIWDVQSGALLTTLTGHAGLVNCAVFSPNGLLIASASDDHKVHLWDIAAGTASTVYDEHTAPVLWVDFGMNGTRLVSGSADKTMRLWRVPGLIITSTRSIAVSASHRSAVTRVRFNATTPAIATAGAGGSIRMWDGLAPFVTILVDGEEVRVENIVEIRMDFMLVQVQVTLVDHLNNDRVTEGPMRVLLYMAVTADIAGNGLETNHQLRLSFGRLDDGTKAAIEASGRDASVVERSLRRTLDRDIPLGIAQGQQVSQIRMRKLFSPGQATLGIYVDLGLRESADGKFRAPRGNVALAQDFRDPEQDIAFATSPGLFAMLGPDAKFQRAERDPGSSAFKFPLRKDMFDPTSEEVGSIDSIEIGPRMQAGTGHPVPTPMGQLDIAVSGDYEDIGFTAHFFLDPRRDGEGIVDWHVESDVDLGLLGTLLVLLGGLVLLLPLLTLGVGIYLYVAMVASLAIGRPLAEYIANKQLAASADVESQAGVVDSMPFRLLAAFRRWDPFYVTNHQVVARLAEPMIIDFRGIAFEGAHLVLDKQPVPRDDIAPRDEVRRMGNVVGIRYEVPDFVALQEAGEFDAKGPGVDRMPFTRDDPTNEPTLVTLTIDEILERKAANRILAPVVLEARRINMFEGQIDQILGITYRVRTQERNRLVAARVRQRKQEIDADMATLVADVTDELTQKLGRAPTQEEIDEAVKLKVETLVDEAKKAYEEGALRQDLDDALAPLLRFDLRPEEMIELQKLGVLTLDGKEIIVRRNKDGTETPYYRDHPDGTFRDNLLALKHYAFPYVPPAP